MLFCLFDEESAPYFYDKDKDSFTFLSLRILCRRIFIKLLNSDNLQINTFDGKAKRNILVSNASKKISAIVFIDITSLNKTQNPGIFMFLNPNADHKIPQFQSYSTFKNAGAIIEDFHYDNY